PIAKIGTEEEARSFVKYAGASYCNVKSILNWSCSNCERNSVKPSDVEYFTDAQTKTAGLLTVDTSKKLIILSYRGSTNLSNWLFNLDILATNANLKYPYDDAKIHNGFNNMANALYDESRDALDRALQKYPNFKIVFTGHSLGGALAGLIAYKLAENGLLYWGRINVITYGQPRLGNAEFAQYLNSKPWTYTRVTSYADIVAISPGITMGYGHNQFNMHINKNGKTIKCSKYEEDPNCISDHFLPSHSAHFSFWNIKMNTKC
ncbi:alpha/beta-hydrolase, partial [Conidiobolus coronatus NRRL 28638]